MYRTRTQKISFEEAELYIRENTLEKLGRSQEQEENYSEQTRQLKMEWSSISDFILYDKFSFKYVEGEDGRKMVPRPLVAACVENNQSVTALRRNDHPYFFADDVEHFVLWKLGAEATTDEDICAAVTCLQQEQKDSCMKYISFKNPPSLMSIPEVHHAHIIVQRIRSTSAGDS